MQRMPVVEMGSRGPQYNPLIKTISILGRRASRSGRMSYSDVRARIETNLREQLLKCNKSSAPTSKIAKIWEDSMPDFPEWALRTGMISEGDLPQWAREQLNRDATMSQRRWTSGSVLGGHLTPLTTPSYNSPANDANQGGGVVIAALFFLGLWWLTRPRQQQVPFPPQTYVKRPRTMLTVHRRSGY